jgi:xylan 1,4-beta-xylosidase
MQLRPETVDSLVCAPMLLQKMEHQLFEAITKLTFKTSSLKEEAGFIIHRTNNSYYTLMKGKSEIILMKKYNGKKESVARVPYQGATVYLKAAGDGLKVQFSFGASEDKMMPIGEVQSLAVVAESSTNRFNGPGVGVYVSSNGSPGRNKAFFDWFDYHQKASNGVFKTD